MATPVLNLRYNIVSVTGSGPNYTLDGFVFDESATFNGTDVAVGDEIFDAIGNRYRISSFSVQTASHLTVVVNDYRTDGMPNTGNGVIFHPSTNYALPVPSRQTNQVSEYLNNFITDQAIQQIDQKIFETNTFMDAFTLSGTDITNGYVTLSQNPTISKPITIQVVGGSLQEYPTDFSIVSNNRATWLGSFAATVVAGDRLLAMYYIS